MCAQSPALVSDMSEITTPPYRRDRWFDEITVLVHPELRGRATAILERHGIRLVPVGDRGDTLVLTVRS